MRKRLKRMKAWFKRRKPRIKKEFKRAFMLFSPALLGMALTPFYGPLVGFVAGMTLATTYTYTLIEIKA